VAAKLFTTENRTLSRLTSQQAGARMLFEDFRTAEVAPGPRARIMDCGSAVDTIGWPGIVSLATAAGPLSWFPGQMPGPLVLYTRQAARHRRSHHEKNCGRL
jgi:hypothetical protein